MISIYLICTKQIECDFMYTDEAEPFTNGINKASIMLRIQVQGVFLKNYHVQDWKLLLANSLEGEISVRVHA